MMWTTDSRTRTNDRTRTNNRTRTNRSAPKLTRSIAVLVAAMLLVAAPSVFAGGEAELTDAEREQMDAIVSEYAQENIEDEEEREEFERQVVQELSERLVDVQGLEIALRAFELGSEDYDGEEHADYVLGVVDRTDEKIRRGESPHEAATRSRFEARERVSQNVSAGEANRERAREMRREARERSERGRDGVPGVGDDDDDGPPGRR